MGDLKPGVCAALAHLADLYASFSEQLKALGKVISELPPNDRYAKKFGKLEMFSGVGGLISMVFLTEMGDLNRFANRRQLGAYLGLAPTTFKSGERSDCRGRITRQGDLPSYDMSCVRRRRR